MKFRLARTIAAVVFATLTPAIAADGAKMAPAERVKSVPKGELKNPLAQTPEIVAEGKLLYQSKTCGACHGGNGGGIHCPSVINDAWIYGSDDDTIFRLITLGSEQMLSGGYARGDQEKHAGPMPGFGEAIGDEQEIWKIVTYIRSLKAGEAAKQQ
jgi:mono/diheme cytochrome c family protein